HPASLASRIGDCLDLVLEVRFCWLVGHVDAGAIDIELPTVVHAPQTTFLVAAEEETCAAVWTVMREQAYASAGVAEGNEPFVQEQHGHGVRVARRKLRRQHGGNPILAHEVAHWRTGSRAANQLVLFAAKHRSLLCLSECVDSRTRSS